MMVIRPRLDTWGSGGVQLLNNHPRATVTSISIHAETGFEDR